MTQKVRAFAQDPQRIAARAVFGAMLALLLVLVLLPLGSSLAQSTTEIHIVNPHETTSLVISDKGNPYHLNSWVNQVPDNPIVEYEIIDADGNPTTIGTATQAGVDTFEYFWTIDEATLPDGDYELRASLYTNPSGSPSLVATDKQPVVLNNEDGGLTSPPEADIAETADIIYPENAGSLGVYITPGEPRETSFIMEVQTSADNRFVQGYYSTTPRGTDPVFEACAEGFQDVNDTKSAVFECTVAKDDFGLDITAVAAVPNDTPDPIGAFGPDSTYNDSADAHTVDAYFQRAGSVFLEPTQIGDAALGSCVTFTATVLDQNSRPIANMNMDVHATGPDDNLRFDTGTDRASNSDESQAPDEGHATKEPAFACEGPTSDTDPSDSGAADGFQGEHQDPTGPDRKHVESVDGTDVQGSWAFSLRSAVAGPTQVTTWADEDDDDLLCSQEKTALGSIGWGEAAPTPDSSAVAETNACSVAEPSPSPSPTPTATSTSSASPSPTDGSPSPTPTSSPTGEPGGEECPGYEGDPRNHIVGTPGDDRLEGTEGDDIICGLGGDDIIDGLGGNDVLLGGDGNDIIRGGDGNDELYGEDGKDDLRGGSGNDYIDGGLQNDVMLGNAGNDIMIGRSGDDIARGGGGDDIARGGGGKDALKGGKGGDDLRGGGGKDTLSGGAGPDELRGGKGADLLKGGAGPDKLFGGGGRDTCDGGGGRNQVKGCEA